MLSAATNIRLGLWLDDLRLGVKAGLKAIAPLGVEAIGLEAFGAELSPRNLSQTGRRDLARLVRSKGAALAALLADVGGRRLADAATLDANLQRLREAAQLAADVGAEFLVVPAGYVPPAESRDEAPVRATLTEAARAVCEMASSSRVRVCWQAGSEAPETLAEFLGSVDSGGLLHVDLNPGAHIMRGFDPLKALSTLCARVAVARATDSYRGGGEAPFGQGDVRWGEVLIGLSALPRPVYVLAGCGLDCDRTAALTGAYQRLSALRVNPAM